ncbi:hypothetical protein POM88_048520 [Heracleum sosnowskyi]|uniref:Uncharacterized protein n=1 Tax=Heracleum sosnowskyi TaxID=360622 RepID=A0AAD8M0J3_9APIA|nr:hypothetical protein POM88_048520 [Heracleum sosnowskyi]
MTERSQNSHIKDPKEISLEDQILLGQDPYIVVSFDEQHKEPNSVVSKQGPEILNSNKVYGQVSPILAIRSTPQAQQPMRKQKRRHNYDDITVLSNRSDKCFAIKKGTTNAFSAALGLWKGKEDMNLASRKFLRRMVKTVLCIG